ncbi:MAG TPA: nuclear transport factor 2 family protein [Mycobacteriales bacterium]|nr:nuclear transport factor 2 family protein [Mycobacteriales bacterium]
MDEEALAGLADKLRTALSGADLEQYAELLDPNVTWGEPGDPSPPCQNRQQVLAWYSRGRAEGRRATVNEVTTYDRKILVAMTVTSADDGQGFDRWQVLTVTGGRVSDIRGYDDEAAARAAAAGR